MQQHWYMLTVVGKDRPGIVANVTAALADTGCNLGETSMIRLGGNFTMMLMVQYDADIEALQTIIAPVANELSLHCHLDVIEGRLHDHRVPDVRISVYGADRIGIVSQVTSALAQAGLDIFDLASDVAGSTENPVYIMNIEGQATQGIEALQQALDHSVDQGIQVHINAIDTMIG